MSTSHYVIRGGLAGRERLRVLALVTWPTTSVLLERVGVAASFRCLDMGCGGGDVTVALARLVPDGFVIGADMDEPQLDLARREATDAGLANLTAVKNLKDLVLSKTEVGDAGLANLKGMKLLAVLNLSGTRVTDAGLTHLRGLPALRLVGLKDTRVTDAGIASLQEGAAMVRVVR